MPTRFRIAVVAGDGVGPEVTREAVRILSTVGEATGIEFKFREMLIAVSR